MHSVYFATTNKEKLLIAQTVCSKFEITVEQASVQRAIAGIPWRR